MSFNDKKIGFLRKSIATDLSGLRDTLFGRVWKALSQKVFQIFTESSVRNTIIYSFKIKPPMYVHCVY